MKRLRDLGEDALIARLLRGFPGGEKLLVGPGDDCAVVDAGRGPLRLLKTDAIVEGVHFLPETPAEKVGWKSIARVLSDFAAMGGVPTVERNPVKQSQDLNELLNMALEFESKAVKCYTEAATFVPPAGT